MSYSPSAWVEPSWRLLLTIHALRRVSWERFVELCRDDGYPQQGARTGYFRPHASPYLAPEDPEVAGYVEVSAAGEAALRRLAVEDPDELLRLLPAIPSLLRHERPEPAAV